MGRGREPPRRAGPLPLRRPVSSGHLLIPAKTGPSFGPSRSSVYRAVASGRHFRIRAGAHIDARCYEHTNWNSSASSGLALRHPDSPGRDGARHVPRYKGSMREAEVFAATASLIERSCRVSRTVLGVHPPGPADCAL
jgi:hypothetical protein